MQLNNFLNFKNSIIIPIFIFCLSCLVIGNITTLPQQPIWDETYYIPAVQKYIDGTFFMESHPPVGKLFMTLGEVVINPNTQYSNLNPIAKLCLANTYIDFDGRQTSVLDYRKQYPLAVDTTNLNSSNNINENNKLPTGYSFCGVRAVPTLFTILIPLLLYILLLIMTDNKYLSLFGSLLVIFENAILVHYRAAMLDSIQMVFIILSLIFFARIIKSKSIAFNSNWVLMSVAIALAIGVKHNALLLLILPLLLLINSINIKNVFKLAVSFGIILCIYTTIFMIHIDYGRNYVVNSQDNMGYYNANDSTKDYLNKTTDTFNYAQIFASNWEYMKNYHLRVPLLNPSNPSENGSYPYKWPFMNKTINYNSYGAKRLVLLGNPIIWSLSLFALILTVWNLIRVAYNKNLIFGQQHMFLFIFMTLYVLYFGLMVVSSNLRVMYLYHYLVALIFSLILLILNIKVLKWDNRQNLNVFIFVITLIILGFLTVSPYTYYLETPPGYILNRLGI